MKYLMVIVEELVNGINRNFSEGLLCLSHNILCLRHNNPSEKLSTSSEVPQNHINRNDC